MHEINYREIAEKAASEPVHIVSRRTETDTACEDHGLSGSWVRTREVLVMSNATEQPQAWSAWKQ